MTARQATSASSLVGAPTGVAGRIFGQKDKQDEQTDAACDQIRLAKHPMILSS